MSPIAIAIALAALFGALAGIAYILVRVLRPVPWRRFAMPGGRMLLYAGQTHEPDGARIAECLERCEALLSTDTYWPRLHVRRALTDVRVFVMDTDSWTDEFGRVISGSQNGMTLVVGRNLAALCHECAHRCEEFLDGHTDDAHSMWASDGTQAAVNAYEAWLGGAK